jgi:uncharacterized membrane protein YdjX (TVP38/TMEM64 family)
LLGLSALITIGLAQYFQRKGVLDPEWLMEGFRKDTTGYLFAFFVLYAVSVAAALPTLPLNLAAGFFWGPLRGGLIAAFSASVGALGGFFLARSVLGQILSRRFDHAIVDRVRSELVSHGWQTIAFLRLNPVFPTGIVNYVLGLTPIKPMSYIWSTFPFMIPPSIAVAWIGWELGTSVADGEAARPLRALFGASTALGFLFGVRFVFRFIADLRRGVS